MRKLGFFLQRIFTRLITTDPYFLYPLLTTALTVFMILGVFLINYRQLPDRLPLFYSLAWGEKELVRKTQFLVLPTIALLTSLINSLLASQINQSYLGLKRILLLSIIFVNLIILITALKILLLFL